jgi:hypothetical protein
MGSKVRSCEHDVCGGVDKSREFHGRLTEKVGSSNKTSDLYPGMPDSNFNQDGDYTFPLFSLFLFQHLPVKLRDNSLILGHNCFIPHLF